MPLGGALTIGAGVVTAVGAVSKYFHHKSDLKKAKQEEANLKTPFYKVQDEYLQNRDIDANKASQGYDSSTLNYLTTESQRGLTSGIDAIQEAGGDPNTVSKLFDTYTNSLRKIGAEDAQMHVANLQQFLERNTAVAGQKNVAFSINELQPYERKLKQLQERKKADVEGQYSAVSDFAGSLAAVGTGLTKPPVDKAAPQSYAPVRNLGQQETISSTPMDKPLPVYNTPQQFLGSNNVYDSVMKSYPTNTVDQLYGN